MKHILAPYVPEFVLDTVFELIKSNNIYLKIVRKRITRHGDYRKNANGTHQITVNASTNKYSFFITLIHEIAHLIAYKKYGENILPHGAEWKHTFQRLMIPFIRPEVFPSELLPLLARHFKNPKASSDTDTTLALALKQYDQPTNKNYVFELPYGSVFRIYNGKIFKKIALRVKRYECMEVATRKIYLFNPNAEVEILKN